MNDFIISSLDKLKEKNIPNPEVDLRVLLNYSKYSNNEIILSNLDLTQINVDLFYKILNRRLANEPISKIINKKSFWKDDFYVNEFVLDPRPETEGIIEETLKIMLDPHASEIKEHEKTLFKVSIMGRWSDHYNSWKSKIGNRFLYIKYEDLVINPNKEFRKILEYLKKLCNIEINEAGFLSSIENTKFEKLKKNEELNGFDQATGNSPFFRKGIVGDWKNNVDKKIIDKIENTFQREMKEIGHL